MFNLVTTVEVGKMLEFHNGSVGKTADALCVSRTTIYYHRDKLLKKGWKRGDLGENPDNVVKQAPQTKKVEVL